MPSPRPDPDNTDEPATRLHVDPEDALPAAADRTTPDHAPEAGDVPDEVVDAARQAREYPADETDEG